MTTQDRSLFAFCLSYFDSNTVLCVCGVCNSQAVNIISLWFRTLRSKKLSRSQHNTRRADLQRLFIETLAITRVDVEDLRGESDKIDDIAGRAKRTEVAMFGIAEYMDIPDVMSYFKRTQRRLDYLGLYQDVASATDDERERHR